MLSDELKGIDWDRTPIRNFLDARPTPKSVAGALIKLGLLSPYEVDDYDWEEIDYASYPSVRRLLLDYASRVPHTKLEDLLNRAGKMLKKGRAIEEPQENPLEAYEQYLATEEPKKAIDELVTIATYPEFLEDIAPKLKEYFGSGLKPPRNLFESALKRAFIYAVEVADRILPPEEDLFKYLGMRLKGRVTTNPFYKKFYSPKELSEMAIEALREAELIARKRTGQKKKPETASYSELVKLLEWARENGNVMKTIIPLELSDAQMREVNTSSIRPSKLLANPTLFAYAVFYNKPLAEKAIMENPTKAKSLLKRLSTLIQMLDEINVESRTVIRKHRISALPVGKADVRRRLAKTVALTISHELNASAVTIERPNQPYLNMPTGTISHVGENIVEARKRWAKDFLSLLQTFLPNFAKEVKREMLKSGHMERPPSDLIVPTLMNPLDEMLAQEIGELAKSERNFSREDWIRLNTYGLRVGDGYVRLYKGRLLHAITAVRVDGKTVELRPYALLYWFDPLTGMILKQTGENSFRVVGVDDIMRELSKKTRTGGGIFGPAYSGAEALGLIFSSGKATQPMRPPTSTSSSRAIGVIGGQGGAGFTETTEEDIKTLKEFMNYNQWVRETIEKVLKENPNPDNFIHYVAMAVRRFGPEETYRAMKFTFRFHVLRDPRLGTLIYRATDSHHYFGRYFF